MKETINFKENIQRTPEAGQFLDGFINFVKVARSEGFPMRMFEAMVGSFTQDPGLMMTLVTESSDLALDRLGQERIHPASSTYPIATALRVVANQNPEIWRKEKNPLSVSSWNSDDILRITREKFSDIVELAGSNSMAKNLHLRAGVILDLLNMSFPEKKIEQQSLAFIELGASAGLIGTALTNGEKFQQWFNKQALATQHNRLAGPLPKNVSAIGIDLVVPNDDWMVACTDDDAIRDNIAQFIRDFPQRIPVFQGDAVDFPKHPEIEKFLQEHPSSKPVVIISNFLYQLPQEKKIQLAKKVREFTIKHNGLVIVIDATSNIDGSSGWCAWIEDKNGRLTPIIEFDDSPVLTWGKPLDQFSHIKTIADIFPESPDSVGEEFAAGLRQSSGYEETQQLIETQGVTNEALNRTPPVGLNLRLLTEMTEVKQLATELNGRPVDAAILGIAIAAGVPDFKKFLNSALNTNWNHLTVMDIDSVILHEIDRLQLPKVTTREVDVRRTGIETASMDIVLLDHLGNCCPPAIDREIQTEVHRILKPGGIAIVNITTSELLAQSLGRNTVSFNFLNESLSPNIKDALRSEIYSLSQLQRKLNLDCSTFRGPILEIEPGSFVVFGENESGHGEWFRLLIDHFQLWQNLGLTVIGKRTREGNDSHIPPLRCRRHNIILRKK